ncbi:MAG: ABC transporter permease [Betaproteobacteria bacterium]
MPFKPVLLWTDAVVLLLLLAVVFYVRHLRRAPLARANWRLALRQPGGAVAATVLAAFVLVGLLDSLHFRVRLPATAEAEAAWSPVTKSVLDLALTRLTYGAENSYSAPLAWRGFQKEAVERDGQVVRDYPRLRYGGAHLTDPERQWLPDVLARAAAGALAGLALAAALAFAVARAYARRHALSPRAAWGDIARGNTEMPLRAVLVTLALLLVATGACAVLSLNYHVFGTDRVGNGLLVVALKSIRTALVIGTMTTLVTLPFAVGLGLAAGYLRGWVDATVQYVYTVINSIPYVLLIAAAVLILQLFIDNNAELFQTSAQRTDARLFFLCVILGLSSWTELCRLVRGETMKLAEMEYVQAAQAFGVRGARILRRHILPNLTHIVLIQTVIAFSTLVLAEAILSYVGVGVDPAMASFGTLISTSRFELAREPAIWWTLATAFAFMFALVLSANLFADAVREAFDPRSRVFRPRRWLRRPARS